MTNLFSKCITLFKKNSRSASILRNVSFSLVFKFANIAISFFMVPITLGYLDKVRYGLWVVLSGLLSWFLIFDIGIGNGLRNKLTELKAKGQMGKAKYYTSTAYFIFSLLAIVSIITVFVLNQLINWSDLLKAPPEMESELTTVVFVVFTIMAFIFVLNLLNTILIADLKVYLSDGIKLIAHGCSFIGVILLNIFTTPSLLNYAITYTGVNLLVLLIATIYFFSNKYKQYKPSPKYIDLAMKNELLSVGIKFFFIQIMGIMLHQITNIILSNLVGPKSVTVYSINLKYYQFAMLFTMIAQPLWTGFADAYHRNNYDWIKLTFKRLKRMIIASTVFMVFMVAFQNKVFELWLSSQIEVDYSLSILCILYLIMQNYMGIYGYFINATGKLKIQMILLSITLPLLVLTITVFVKNIHEIFGFVSGWLPFLSRIDNVTSNLEAKALLFVLIINRLIYSIVYNIQSKKILNNSPGIWCE